MRYFRESKKVFKTELKEAKHPEIPLDGVVLPLEVTHNSNLRVLDLQKHYNDPFMVALESRHRTRIGIQSGYDWIAIFKELREKFKIDVVIHFKGSPDGKSKNVVMLNQAAFNLPKNYGEVLSFYNRSILDADHDAAPRILMWRQLASVRQHASSLESNLPESISGEALVKSCLELVEHDPVRGPKAAPNLGYLKWLGLLKPEDEAQAKRGLLKILAKTNFLNSIGVTGDLEVDLALSTPVEIGELIRIQSHSDPHGHAKHLLELYLNNPEKRSLVIDTYLSVMKEDLTISGYFLGDFLDSNNISLTEAQIDAFIRLAERNPESKQARFAFWSLYNSGAKGTTAERIANLARSFLGGPYDREATRSLEGLGLETTGIEPTAVVTNKPARGLMPFCGFFRLIKNLQTKGKP